MSMTIYNYVDEQDIGEAIARGDVRLELILMAAFDGNEERCTVLIRDIEPVGGTSQAGELAERFAKAMQKA